MDTPLLNREKTITREVVLNEMSIAIATPCYGNQYTQQYAVSLFRTLPKLLQYGISYMLTSTSQESIISKARNWCAFDFLRSNMTHLLFIDADMEWEAESIMRLMASGKDVIGAAGPRKAIPTSYCANLALDENNMPIIDKQLGIIEVNEIGTGFLLISRKALERMMGQNPDNWYYEPHTNDKIYNFFELLIVDHIFRSEDYSFCYKWKQLGEKIYCDPTIELGHVGFYNYKGKFLDELEKKPDDVASKNTDSNPVT